MASAVQTDARVAAVRRAPRRLAASRPATFDALLQQVVVDRQAQDVAAEWEAATEGAIRASEIVDSPFLLIAPSLKEAAEELLRRSERWGITSWCTHAPSGPALAQVAAAVRA